MAPYSKPLIATLAVMSGLGGLPTLAQGNGPLVCGDRDQIVHQLETHYGESVRSIGLAPQNRIIEMFASDETGSWTITVTSVDGTTCLMASGQHFEMFAAALPGEAL